MWPHGNAIIALGFRRYGFVAAAGRIASDLNRAASNFLLNQMPELFAGLTRVPRGFPVQCVGANVPQAWAAGSVFMTLNTVLGLRPDAARDRLEIDPVLPPGSLTSRFLACVLGHTASTSDFWRESNCTMFDVLRGDKALIVRHATVA